ncbi:MAG: zinc-dependent dehydrogenase, partial [Candidatus Bathyarchaeota archaeon]|nr:zinc-dependent dehydrogenase [Candidatus Bathyarchaeota archaeon]
AKMKVAMYYSQQDIRIEETQTPKIGEDEVLVKMKACGICGSDLMEWYLKTRAPLVLGHEPAGIIIEKGAAAYGFEIGDRVFVHHHVACQECDYCMRGDYTMCSQFHETNIKPGGFAQYFKVPSPNLRLDTLKIPETLSFEEATLIEPIGCCLRALRKCNVQKGSNIAIVGAGTTGLIQIALAKIHGASMVFSSDLLDYRLEVARKYGAEVVVDVRKENLAEVVHSHTHGKGADVVVVTAPSLKAYEDGLKACRKGGTLCVFAPTGPGELLQISPKELFFSEIHIIPSYSTSHLETRAALELIESGKLDVKALITHRFRLEETAKAFETARECRKSLKVVVFDE